MKDCSLPLPVDVMVSLEQPSISVNESEGTYMACVSKDRDTVHPLTVQITQLSGGSALRRIGKYCHKLCLHYRSNLVSTQIQSGFASSVNAANPD